MTDRPVKFQARYPGTVSTPPGPPGAHTHAEADVTSLVADLALKAPIASPTFTGTVSGVTKTMVGLGSVDNTADTAKPVSTAQQTALNLKADDNAVVKLAGTQTITGTKTVDVALVQTYQGSTPATPAAGKATGPYFGADGLPYYLTPAGVVVPLSIGEVGTALHGNASFETVSGSTPTVWNFGWQAGGSTVTTETTDIFIGTRSATVTIPAGGANNQVLMSDVFTVAPGDTVVMGAWAHAITGSPTIQIGLLSAASGTPDFFDGVSTYQEGEVTALAATFTKYGKSAQVPAGHTVARLTFRFKPGAAEANTSRIDFTTSTRTGASTSVLPGNAWPKEACRLLTTAAFAPTTAAPNSVDGVTPAVGDRILKATVAGASTDGIWTVVTVGSGSNGVWARASDASTAAQVAGAEVAITTGTTYGGTRWGTSFKATDTFGTTAMVWTKILTDSATVALTGALTVASTSTFSGDVTLSGSGTDISVGGHATITGTGWVDLTLAAGFGDLSAFGWRKPQYRREGNKVWLRGLVNRTGALTAANITMLTLPAGAQLNGGSTTGANDQIFITRSSVGYSAVSVLDTAAVQNGAAMATNDWTSLDGIFFTTD